MEKDVLIKAEHVSKKFAKNLKKSLFYGVQDLISGISGRTQHNDLRKDEFWAVKDISFEVKRGECLGLIGHNGAGKSTLLKILNGLIAPDEGTVTIKGKIGALIELGAGFNPILSGRENIYNNAAVIGFIKKEIDEKLDAIIAFAELEEFIDMPVQNYSSGMKVRLGFAIAAQMEPDVLIIDEVLAVGDANFRAKCFNKMSELSKRCAMIFVSHSMPLLGRICSSGLLMRKGELLIIDEINEVIHNYMMDQDLSIENAVGDIIPEYYNIKLSRNQIRYMEELEVDFSILLPNSIKKFILHYSILDQEMKTIYQAFSLTDDLIFENKNKEIRIKFLIENIDLTNGKYFLNIGLIENDFKGKNICRFDGAESFIVSGSKYNSFGSIVKKTKWEVIS
ncbi:ABC transporter ATP-binding protein [Mariniflexile jejuense]|uniref:ABC transporter ATP-binding protein n=1 Tax=Mariniflexile jejuense TaxID=1173582 RepID=A0ABW3JGF2_9FLAO